MVYQTDELARLRRQRSEQAIKAALQSRWDEAVQLNQQIIELTGGRDGDAFNRLGRALMAIGRYRDAREAYGRALQIDPTNQIARKNYASLQQKAQDESPAPAAPRDYVDPKLFVEETGKSGVTALVRPQREATRHMTAGERVLLRRDGNQLFADNSAGELLGQVEPRLALRLLRFMDGGNQYAAAISALTHDGARIIIKETYQHPSQVGRPSFPPSGLDGTPRPYTREGLVRYDDEDEEVLEEIEAGEGWDSDGDGQETTGDVRLLDYQKTQEHDDGEVSPYDDE